MPISIDDIDFSTHIGNVVLLSIVISISLKPCMKNSLKPQRSYILPIRIRHLVRILIFNTKNKQMRKDFPKVYREEFLEILHGRFISR